jgi:hypothetical protein
MPCELRDARSVRRAWRRDDVGWLGFVNYSESPGLRWLEWVAAERVQPAETANTLLTRYSRFHGL